MGRKFDPLSLFGDLIRDPKLVAYPTWKAELDALQSGKKGMTRLGTSVSAIAEGDPDLIDLLEKVAQRQLAVVLFHEYPVREWPWERQHLQLYIARPDQLWRLPAILALNETAMAGGGWGAGAENQQSYLLGYSKAQRKRWLAARRKDGPADSCMMLYAFLDEVAARRVRALGHRSFGTAKEIESLELFFPRIGHDYLKPNAFRLLPKGVTLARIGLGWKLARALIGDPKKLGNRRIVKLRLNTAFAKQLNAHLVSNVQLLTARGWRG